MKTFLAMCAMLCVISSPVFADSTVSRYMTLHDGATSEQKDLLSQTIHVQFPVTVHTIGDAINYCLQFSGYALVPITQQNKAMQLTLTKPLPVIDKDFGPMPLREALSTLAGSAFTLQEDKLNRTVNFALKPAFQAQKHFIKHIH